MTGGVILIFDRSRGGVHDWCMILIFDRGRGGVCGSVE